MKLYRSVATLNSNTVISNTANMWGGGVCLWSSDATMIGNTVISNTAYDKGGGGMYVDDSDATWTNTVVADNQAHTAGSGLYIKNSSLRLLHTTIARNRGGDGSGVYVTEDYFGNPSTVALTNTILVSHTVGITVAAGSMARLNATLWHVNSTRWSGNVIHTNDHSGDPAFAADGYHLTDASAAIDKGVDAGIATDIDGKPRPVGTGYDIGADEYYHPALDLTKQADPDPVHAGAQLTYTIRVTNTGNIDLHATVTDTLPAHVTLTGVLTWTPTITAPGGVWTQQVVVTVEMGYAAPLSNLVQVTTEEGATGTDTSIVTVVKQVTVEPSQEVTIVATSADGMTTTVEVPAGAVTETLQLAYTSVPTVTGSPSGFAFAGRAFRLEAYRNGTLLPGFTFEEPITVTIHYTETDVAGLDEDTLELYYWTGNAWSMDGITAVERDTTDNRLVVRLDHLSEFAMFAGGQRKVYLPLVLRNY